MWGRHGRTSILLLSHVSKLQLLSASWPTCSMISSRLREAQARTATGPRAELVQHLGRPAIAMQCNARSMVWPAHRAASRGRTTLQAQATFLSDHSANMTSGANPVKTTPSYRAVQGRIECICAAKTQAPNAAPKLGDVDEASEAEFPSSGTPSPQ